MSILGVIWLGIFAHTLVEADAKTAVDVSLDVNMHSKRAEAAKDPSENLSEEDLSKDTIETPDNSSQICNYDLPRIGRCKVCTLGPETGPCYGAFPMFYYDFLSGLCKEFIYGGCLGNGNRFKTREECQAKCDGSTPAGAFPPFCELEPEQGSCEADFPRYYFDYHGSRTCKMFTYGGCGANLNNFRTLEECSTTCRINELKVIDPPRKTTSNPDLPAPSSVEGPPIVEPPVKPNRAPELCHLNAEQGPCKGRFPRYFYDRRRGIEDCKEFIWGGCGGNDNKFLTKEQCLEVCNPDLVGPLVVDPPEIWNNGK